MRKITRRRLLKLAGLGAAAGLVGLYPTFIERNIVLTNHYHIPVPNLPDAFKGLRIVHLTDVHLGPLVSKEAVHRIVERVNRIPRDLVICTGDYVHKSNITEEIEGVWPILTKLTAPLGVFSVLGNHDHWANTECSLHCLKKSGQSLHHKTQSIEKDKQRIWLAGAGDFMEDKTPLDNLLADIPESDCRLVLAHNPDTADTQYSTRIDLMLSGHTHGGQVNIPFIGTPVLPVKNKDYSSGLKRSPCGTPVFISRGTGWAVYPVRFNCYPEIAVLELVKDESPTKNIE